MSIQPSIYLFIYLFLSNHPSNFFIYCYPSNHPYFSIHPTVNLLNSFVFLPTIHLFFSIHPTIHIYCLYIQPSIYLLSIYVFLSIHFVYPSNHHFMFSCSSNHPSIFSSIHLFFSFHPVIHVYINPTILLFFFCPSNHQYFCISILSSICQSIQPSFYCCPVHVSIHLSF